MWWKISELLWICGFLLNTNGWIELNNDVFSERGSPNTPKIAQESALASNETICRKTPRIVKGIKGGKKSKKLEKQVSVAASIITRSKTRSVENEECSGSNLVDVALCPKLTSDIIEENVENKSRSKNRKRNRSSKGNLKKISTLYANKTVGESTGENSTNRSDIRSFFAGRQVVNSGVCSGAPGNSQLTSQISEQVTFKNQLTTTIESPQQGASIKVVNIIHTKNSNLLNNNQGGKRLIPSKEVSTEIPVEGAKSIGCFGNGDSPVIQ